jgi:hypothetical protein
MKSIISGTVATLIFGALNLFVYETAGIETMLCVALAIITTAIIDLKDKKEE